MEALEENEWFEFYRVMKAEIPVSLGTRSLVRLGRGGAFWADSFRGFTTGFTFVTRYRFDEDRVSKTAPEDWPDLTATTSIDASASVEVVIDGEHRSNLMHGVGHLHLVGANSVPGIAMAEWWVPQLPRRALSIVFRYEPFSDAARMDVSFDEWSAMIAGGIITL